MNLVDKIFLLKDASNWLVKLNFTVNQKKLFEFVDRFSEEVNFFIFWNNGRRLVGFLVN